MLDTSSFEWQDYLVFTVILLISASIGLVHAVRGGTQGTITEYLLANRKLQWLPVGLSILVTFQSAILFIGVPAEVYTYGLSYLLFHVGMSVSVLISACVFVPLLFPLKLTSTYEYLEMRFQSRLVRMIGSFLGMVNMSMYMGVVLFAPATAIEAVSDIPVWISILVIGTTATLYTTLGGLRAVIWTDVFQFCVMFSGLLAVLIQGCVVSGGLGHIWKQSSGGDRIDFGSVTFDPRVRHSVFSLLIGGTFTWLANIGVNQSNVQRFSAVPSLKAAKFAVLVSLPGFVIFGSLASLLGLIVYSYFSDQSCDPVHAGIVKNPNQLVPLFVMDIFSEWPGFCGLFVASLVAASLSTVSSSINSLGAMLWEDIFKCRFKTTKPQTSTKIVKIFVLLFGFVAMLVALIASQLGGPATQIALAFFGASGGPLLGMFLLGALYPRANWIGVSCGAVVSLILCLWLAIGKYSIPPDPPLQAITTDCCDHYMSIHHNSNTSAYSNTIATNGHHYVINSNTSDNNYIAHSNSHNNSIFKENTTCVQKNSVLYHNDFNSTSGGNASSYDTDYGIFVEFYRISYLWYSTIGLCTVFVIGIIVTHLTESRISQLRYNSNLLICQPQCCSQNLGNNGNQPPQCCSFNHNDQLDCDSVNNQNHGADIDLLAGNGQQQNQCINAELHLLDAESSFRSSDETKQTELEDQSVLNHSFK